MSTIALVAQQPCPLKIFDDRGEAAAWLADRMNDPSVSAADLSGALADVERAYDQYVAERG